MAGETGSERDGENKMQHDNEATSKYSQSPYRGHIGLSLLAQTFEQIDTARENGTEQKAKM